MNTNKPLLNFAEKTNPTILGLVDICCSSLKLSYKSTLITKPVDEIYQSQYQAINENAEYPEREDSVPIINNSQ